MIITGFTDEAGEDLETQIRVARELEWDYLSARTFGSGNIHDIEDREFEAVCRRLSEESIKVAEFGSLIANWSKSIHSPWDLTAQEIDRCIDRMHRLDVGYVRIMSYAQEPWGSDQLEKERFRRVAEIHRIFASEGLEALHENCMNYGGFSSDHTLRLLDAVPDMRLVFDTGNPVTQRDRSKPPEYPWQNSLKFYHDVKHAIAHIHIKDAKREEGKIEYTFPGEGDAYVREILWDMKLSGYGGFIAIEPHMAKVFHQINYDQYDGDRAALFIEYGEKMKTLIQDLL